MSDDNSRSSFLPGQEGENAPLGNNTLFVATASQSGAFGGQKRLKRFWLQSLVRQLLPGERVAKCLRVRLTPAVAVLYSPLIEKAHLGGLMVCGSPWVCPVCSSKIAVRRREELERGVAAWRARGGQLVMVTYTLRHSVHDRAGVLVDALLAAYRAMHMARAWRELKKRSGVAGQVRGLEVTFGEQSGFHPHCHEILFLESGVDVVAFQDELRSIWLHELGRLGRDASWEHGLQVDNADQRVSEYVAKWGHDPVDTYWTIAQELTQGLQKASRDGSMSVWQLLEAYDVTSRTGGVNDWGTKFIEYARAFKGKSQLQWSTGLRALLGLAADQTDEELADEQREDAILLALLAPKQWDLVLAHDARGQLLQVAEVAGKTGDASLLPGFLERLAAGPASVLPD